MGLQTLRVFIGNLPLNVTEDDIKDLVQRHAQVTSVELKHKNNGAFAFVDLKDTPKKIDHCFGKLSSKVWKGSQLKIQKAKESFLQRLEKERMENKNESKKVSDQSKIITSSESQNTISVQKKKSILNNESKETKSSVEDASLGAESDDDCKYPRKGHLPMFRGTLVAFSNKIDNLDYEAENNQHLVPKKINNKVDKGKEILQKFEAFSNVWEDSSDEDQDLKHTLHSQKINKSSHVKVDECEVVNKCNDILNVSRTRLQDDLSMQKSHQSEKRRLKAIDDRQRELFQRKEVIKLALANGKRTNKKIIFDDADVTHESLHNEPLTGDKNKKLKLFDDNEIEVENSYDDFRIKNQFEGRKGQSLMKLQAQYSNDERFKLDERFIESDEEGETEFQSNELDPAKEHQKDLEILGDVLGRDIVNKDKVKNRHSIKPMLRYDPTQPNHVKFKVRDDFKEVKTKQSIWQEDNVEESDKLTPKQNKADEVNLPIVSKEKFYHVSDSLKQSLQNKEKPFSLLEMFGDVVEEEKEDIPFDVKPLHKKKEWSLDPFNVQSTGLDDADIEGNDNSTSDVKAIKMDEYGVTQESLFFVKNDERFTEGLEFIKYRNEEYYEKFSEKREKFKVIVKKKLLSSKKKENPWKRKIGGNRKNFKKK